MSKGGDIVDDGDYGNGGAGGDGPSHRLKDRIWDEGLSTRRGRNESGDD